jgi:hypothetical protein
MAMATTATWFITNHTFIIIYQPNQMNNSMAKVSHTSSKQ